MKNNTITVKEFADLYNLGLNSAYIIVRSKDFPKINIGKKILIFKNELPEWFKKHQGEDLVS